MLHGFVPSTASSFLCERTLIHISQFKKIQFLVNYVLLLSIESWETCKDTACSRFNMSCCKVACQIRAYWIRINLVTGFIGWGLGGTQRLLYVQMFFLLKNRDGVFHFVLKDGFLMSSLMCWCPGEWKMWCLDQKQLIVKFRLPVAILSALCTQGYIFKLLVVLFRLVRNYKTQSHLDGIPTTANPWSRHMGE